MGSRGQHKVLERQRQESVLVSQRTFLYYCGKSAGRLAVFRNLPFAMYCSHQPSLCAIGMVTIQPSSLQQLIWYRFFFKTWGVTTIVYIYD